MTGAGAPRRRWLSPAAAAAATLLMVAAAVIGAAAEGHRRTAASLRDLQQLVVTIHAEWTRAERIEAGHRQAAGVRAGSVLDDISDGPFDGSPLRHAAAIIDRVYPPARTVGVSAIAAAFMDYANAAAVPGGDAVDVRGLNARFIPLSAAIEGAHAAAAGKASAMTLAAIGGGVVALGILVAIGAAAYRRRNRPTVVPRKETLVTSKPSLQPVLVVDAQGVIRRADGALAGILGTTPTVGAKLASLVHADDAAAVTRFVAQAAREPRSSVPLTFRPKQLDGKWVAAELVAGRRDGDTIQGGLSIKLVDATSRIQGEDVLRKSGEIVQTLVDALPLAVVIEDGSGCVRLWNAAAERTFGWTADQVIGRANPCVPAEAAEEQRNLRKRVSEGQAFTGLEARRVKSDGTTIDVSITMVQLKRADGRKGDLMEVIVDVTDRKHLEGQLRQAQKMEAVGRLAGGIAHDFNNLLTAIVGHADMLLKLPELAAADQPSPSVIRFGIDQIHRAGERAAALTQQLLAFSRAQVLQPTVLNLNAAVGEMEPMLRRLIGEDIDFAFAGGTHLESIKADPTQIAQVIMNLVLNARDAMPTGGRLTIETHNVELDDAYARRRVPVIPGPYVMLAVSDTGVGMDQETQARIFEPFFTTKEKGQGTGLGLATVYGIVRQSGGYIWVYSEPGHGTSFKVYLPSAERRVGASEPTARPAAAPLNGSETVLLVEDEEMVRALVQQVLTWYGYHVLVAHNGEAALKLAADYPGKIDLMLTDIVMPGMSALDLAAQLQSARPDTKVLYMSGYTDHAVVRNNLLDSKRAFLQKPFAPDRLAHKVREVLNDRAAEAPRQAPERTGRGPARVLPLVNAR